MRFRKKKYTTKDIVTFYNAIYENDLSLVKSMVKKMKINRLYLEDLTALHWATQLSKEDVIRLLLKKGAYVNVPNMAGYTPLHIAAQYSTTRVVKLLLEEGADVNARNHRGRTPLFNAVDSRTNDDLDFLWRVVSGNADVTFKRVGSRIEAVQLMLNYGADVNSLDEEGETPLLTSIQNRNISMVKFLLDKGAHPNVMCKKNSTPLSTACVMGKVECVQSLLVRGADVNIFDKVYPPPLSAAPSKGPLAVVGLLLSWGATLNRNSDIVEDRASSTHYYYPVAEEFHKHFIKLKLAKLITDTKNQPEINGLDTFHKMCEEELTRIREKRFGRLSLYCVFSMYTYPAFVLNEEIEQTIKSSSLTKEFPIYENLLKCWFRRAKTRWALMSKAQCCFPLPLPAETTDKILTYVSDEDLVNIVKAFDGVQND